MKFRARLLDPANTTAERPQDFYSNSREEIDHWAREVLKKALAEDAAVNVYEMIEQQIAIIVRPR